MANNNRERQNERRKQEMERRRAAAEAQQKALAQKQKRTAIIITVAVLLVIAIVCGVAIPVGINKSREYTKVNFKALAVPTTKSEATAMVGYNNKKVELEGYTFPCTSIYYVLCKTTVNSCPYVEGSVPSDGVRMNMAGYYYFDNIGQNKHVRVKGTLHVNTLTVDYFEGYETWMYLVVDKIEVLD